MKTRLKFPYKQHPHQKVFHSWKGKDGVVVKKAIVTGYGGGKTHAFVREMFRLAVINSPLPVLCVEPTYPMIKDILAISFEEFFDLNELTYRIVGYKDIYISDFDATIWMRSGDNPRSLKGPNLAAAGIDEPFMQSVDVYKQVVARVRHPQASEKMIVLSGTPEGLGWGYDLLRSVPCVRTIETEQGEVRVYESDDMNWVQCSARLNTALDDTYCLDVESAHTELEAESYVGGKFVNMMQGRCYYSYSDANDADIVLDYGRPVCISCDFNATEKPMSWNVSQEQNGATCVRFSLWRQFTNTYAMCEYLEEVLREHGNGHLPVALHFYGDYSGNQQTSNSTYSDWEIIRSYFVNKTQYERFIKPCKSVRGRISATNARLLNALGERHLYIQKGDDCEHLRRDFNEVVWHIGGTIEDQTISHLRTHAASALSYMIDFEYPIRPRQTVRHG